MIEIGAIVICKEEGMKGGPAGVFSSGGMLDREMLTCYII